MTRLSVTSTEKGAGQVTDNCACPAPFVPDSIVLKPIVRDLRCRKIPMSVTLFGGAGQVTDAAENRHFLPSVLYLLSNFIKRIREKGWQLFPEICRIGSGQWKRG